jgi:outer membrane protein assembly factor BamB
VIRRIFIIILILCQVGLLGFAQDKKKAKPKPSFSELWIHEISASDEGSTETSRAITAPIIAGDQRVFFASKNGFVFAVNENDGEKLWEFNAGHSVSRSLILQNERIFFATDKEIFCLNKEDGQLFWRKGLGLEITSPLEYFDGALYLAAKNNSIYCFKEQNGEIVWEHAIGTPVYSPFIIYKGLLLFGTDSGNICSLLSSTGQLLWQLKIGDKLRAAPLIIDRSLYIGSFDNYIYAVNLHKKTLKWKVRTGADIEAQVIAWKDYVYAASFDGYLYCLKKGSGHLHYRRSLPARPYNAPIIVNNVMYIQTLSNKLVSIIPETGKGVSSYDAKYLITSPICTSSDGKKMFLGTNEGTLIALSLQPKKKKEGAKDADITEGEEGEKEEEETEEGTEKVGEIFEEMQPEEQIGEPEEKAKEVIKEETIKIAEPIDLAVPYNKEIFQKSMELFSKGNYAGAAIGWAQMVAELDPSNYTIAIGLYCTSDSLEKIYQNRAQESFIFFLPKPHEGKICYQVCLGLFPSAKEAEEKLGQLPEFFQQEKPVISTLMELLH